MKETKEIKGAFSGSLKRSNDKIKEDRVKQITESAELFYSREIENIELKIKGLKNEREAYLDISTYKEYNVASPAEFDAIKFVNKDADISVNIHQLELLLKIVQDRYNFLFKK